MNQNKPLIFQDKAYLEQCQQRQTFLNHIHWDGSIPAEYLFALAQKKGKELLLPELDNDGQRIIYSSAAERVIDSPAKLRAFQQGLFTKYSIIDVFAVPISFMQTRADLITMAVAHCHYLKSQNTVYAESQFAPQYHLSQGLSLDQVIGYALEGFAQGKEETGVNVKLIIDIGREAPLEVGEAVIRAATLFVGRGVVGSGLACCEPGNPPEKFSSAFKLARDANLNITIHANEMIFGKEGLRNIYTAIKMGAKGIAHGCDLHQRLYKHHDLVELMIKNNVRFEANPISNYSCGFIKDVKDLHLDKLVRDGLLVTINPDDPAMWPNGDMAHNLYVMGKLSGNQFVDTVIENSITSAWGLSSEEKQKYLKELAKK